MIKQYINKLSNNLDPIAPDLINALPKDILNEIFSYLKFEDLNVCGQVCRNWKVEIDNPEKSKMRMYKQIAFSPEDWRKCFEKDILTDLDCIEALSSLPQNIYQILKSPCPAFSGKRLGDTHLLVWIPKNINGKSLTLNTLKELDKYITASVAICSIIWDSIYNPEGTKSIDQSCWVLMTKNVLPESRGKSYDCQKEIVSNLAKKALTAYEVPTALKTAVCIVTHHFKTGERLFAHNPDTYTRCQESDNGTQLIVGGLARAGLRVMFYYYYVSDIIGVAALRKL